MLPVRNTCNGEKERKCTILLFAAQPLTAEANQLALSGDDDIFIAFFPGEVELRETVWRKVMDEKKGARIVT